MRREHKRAAHIEPRTHLTAYAVRPLFDKARRVTSWYVSICRVSVVCVFFLCESWCPLRGLLLRPPVAAFRSPLCGSFLQTPVVRLPFLFLVAFILCLLFAASAAVLSHICVCGHSQWYRRFGQGLFAQARVNPRSRVRIAVAPPFFYLCWRQRCAAPFQRTLLHAVVTPPPVPLQAPQKSPAWPSTGQKKTPKK